MRQNFVEIFPFNQRYFDTLLLIFFLILLLYGWWKLMACYKNGNNKFIVRQKDKVKSVILKWRASWHFTQFSSLILYLIFISVGSIFLDTYYFDGLHLLTERMDLIVDLTFLFLILWAIFFLVESAKKQIKFYNYKFPLLKILIIILFSFIAGSTYISGPVYGRATQSHYQAMQLIYRDMQKREYLNFCVLSEQFPLAALEAVSMGQIINGNFPIKYRYAENNVNLFIKMFSKPDIKWIKQALELSNSSGCYLVLDSRFLADWNKTQIRWLLGKEIAQVDDVYIWLYDGN